MVIRTHRIGEADRIVVLLTEGHGKVRAVAKGVRRTASRFGARLEPMSHVSLLLWQGRGDLDTVNQAEAVDTYPVIRSDLDRVTQALSLLEVVDQLAQERHRRPRLYRMLVGALSVLDDPERAPDLVAPAFFLKALVLEGAGPVLDSCASCGWRPRARRRRAGRLRPDRGRRAVPAMPAGAALSQAALDLMRSIMGGGLGGVLRGAVPPGSAEVAELATEAMEVHLDRRLRSVRSVAGLWGL